MTRLVLLAALALGLATSLPACDKPSTSDCKRALLNMQHLMGTDNLLENGGVDSEIRACQAGSTKKSVQCAINATTMDELRHCEFYKVRAKAAGSGGSGSGSGSAAAGSGSAAAPAPAPAPAGSAGSGT